MPADAESARPLEALGRVLTSVEAVRNGPAWFALLLAFSAAGWLLACADLALTANAPTAAAAWGGVSLTVLFYGTNTAGLLLMDQARGVAPRQARQRLVLVSGGLVFMLALALPALVYIRGTCSVYLALEGHGASGGAD